MKNSLSRFFHFYSLSDTSVQGVGDASINHVGETTMTNGNILYRRRSTISNSMINNC